MSLDKTYITSGRNTIIHKMKKFDLLLVNSESDPLVLVTQGGVKLYKGEVPRNKAEAKRNYMEVIYLSSADVFGERKSLVFVQALDNREYKIDYTKAGTPLFVRVHQENYI